MMLVMEAFRRAADFNGRSSRDEFVSFFGTILAVLVVLSVVAGNQYGTAVFPLALVGLALCAIPALSLTVRRLHDQNRGPQVLGGVVLTFVASHIVQALHRSLQFTFLGSFLQILVWGVGFALLGGLGYVVYLGFQPGDEGVNDYGPPPAKIIAPPMDHAAMPLSIGVQTGPPIGAQKGPPFQDGARLIGHAPLRCARRREGGARPEARAAQSILIPVCSGDQFRFLKRQLSLPVSMMSQ